MKSVSHVNVQGTEQRNLSTKRILLAQEYNR